MPGLHAVKTVCRVEGNCRVSWYFPRGLSLWAAAFAQHIARRVLVYTKVQLECRANTIKAFPSSKTFSKVILYHSNMEPSFHRLTVFDALLFAHCYCFFGALPSTIIDLWNGVEPFHLTPLYSQQELLFCIALISTTSIVLLALSKRFNSILHEFSSNTSL